MQWCCTRFCLSLHPPSELHMMCSTSTWSLSTLGNNCYGTTPPLFAPWQFQSQAWVKEEGNAKAESLLRLDRRKQSLCPAVMLAFSFSMADDRGWIVWHHILAVIHTLHLLHWIVVSVGKAQLHHPSSDHITSLVCCHLYFGFIVFYHCLIGKS